MTILLRQKPLPQVVRQIVQRDNGAWFDPSDLSTLFQDAAGTTPVTDVEQPVGLWLDRARGMMMGPELVSNGTFDTDASGWTAGLSVLSVSSGVIRVTNTNANYGYARQVINTVIGKMYEYKGVFVGGTGASSLAVKIGTTNYSASAFASGIKFLATETTTTIQLNVGTNVIGAYMEFDSASLKELYGYHATQSITASRPTLSARYNLLTKTEDFSDAVWIKTPLTTQSAKVLSFSAGANSRVTQVVSGSGDFTITAVFSSADVGKRIQLGFWASGIDGISASGRSGDLVIPDSGIVSFTKTGLVSMTNIGIINSADGVAKTVTLRDGFGVSLLPTSTLFQYQRVNTATDYDTDERYFKKYLRFDGVDDYLNLPYMGLYANGSASVVIAGEIDTSVATHRVIHESSSTVEAPMYSLRTFTSPNSGFGIAIANDAGTLLLVQNKAIQSGALKVLSCVDNGVSVKAAINSTDIQIDSYARSGSLTLNNTTIGAKVSVATSGYMPAKLYGIIITKSALTDSQRVACERYLGRKSGVQL